MLLVHAHPDDESITTGATMAHYAAQGTGVTLLTCTLGEEGEILVPELARLEAAQADQLGGYRIGELTDAMRALGVSDHRFLGGAGRFRDSGMIGTPANEHLRAFWRADSDPHVFAAAVAGAVEVIREVRPHVVVTYDPDGGYGHPDHIMAHRVATEAVLQAADATRGDRRDAGTGEPWEVAKVYWALTPESVLRRGNETLRADVGQPFQVVDEIAFPVADAFVTTAIDASAFTAAKTEALRAHRTQVTVHGGYYALSNAVGRVICGVEHFRLVQGEPGGEKDADGRETDLFAGILP